MMMMTMIKHYGSKLHKDFFHILLFSKFLTGFHAFLLTIQKKQIHCTMIFAGETFRSWLGFVVELEELYVPSTKSLVDELPPCWVSC